MRQPLDPAQAEPRHEQIAAEIPVRAREVARRRSGGPPRARRRDSPSRSGGARRRSRRSRCRPRARRRRARSRAARILLRAVPDAADAPSLVLAAPRRCASPRRPRRSAARRRRPDRRHAGGRPDHARARGNDFVQAAFGGVDRVDCGARHRHRQRRRGRPRRRELRDRLAPALRRPVDELRQPARDRGRAGQLLVGLDGRRRVPARPASRAARRRTSARPSRRDAGRTWQRSVAARA